MPASGVRRSCDTAESRAVRAELSRASAAASPAACWSARRWRMAPACAAKAASSRCRSAGTCTPTSTRSCSSSAVAWVSTSQSLGCRGRPARARSSGAATASETTSATTSAGRVGRRPPHDDRALRPEHVDGVLEQHGHLVGRAEQGVGQLGQGGRLPLRRDRPPRPAGRWCARRTPRPRRPATNTTSAIGVLRLGDGEGADRLGEEPVEQPRARRQRADERRPDAAEQGDEHGDEQVERHGEGQPGVLGQQDEQAGEHQGGPTTASGIPEANSPARQRGPRHPPATPGGERVGHDVHVDVAGVGDDLLGGARHRPGCASACAGCCR